MKEKPIIACVTFTLLYSSATDPDFGIAITGNAEASLRIKGIPMCNRNEDFQTRRIFLKVEMEI